MGKIKDFFKKKSQPLYANEGVIRNEQMSRLLYFLYDPSIKPEDERIIHREIVRRVVKALGLEKQ